MAWGQAFRGVLRGVGGGGREDRQAGGGGVAAGTAAVRCTRATTAAKPRGAEIAGAGEAFKLRHSLCCGRRGCRRRALPPSLRFLGRRVYLEAVVLIATAITLVMRGSSRTCSGRDRRPGAHAAALADLVDHQLSATSDLDGPASALRAPAAGGEGATEVVARSFRRLVAGRDGERCAGARGALAGAADDRVGARRITFCVRRARPLTSRKRWCFAWFCPTRSVVGVEGATADRGGARRQDGHD